MQSTLLVTQGPSQEAVSLAQAKRHLRLDHNDDDDLLKDVYIPAARQLAEGFLGRSLVTQNFLWTMSDRLPPGMFPLLPPPLATVPMTWLSFSGVWNQRLELPRSPVQAITAFTVLNADGTTSNLASGPDYISDLTLEPATVRLMGGVFPETARHIQIAFRAGISDDPTEIEAIYKLGILHTIAAIYENRGDTDVLPKMATDILWQRRIVYFGG